MVVNIVSRVAMRGKSAATGGRFMKEDDCCPKMKRQREAKDLW
jgi:hypothetical protein